MEVPQRSASVSSVTALLPCYVCFLQGVGEKRDTECLHERTNGNGMQNGMHNGLHNGGRVARQQKRGIVQRALAWVDAKIYVYNVTVGLYMLDWWERVLFNVLALLLLWFLCHNISEFFIRSVKDPLQAFQGWIPLWSKGSSVNGDV